jgi:hypothetical protein
MTAEKSAFASIETVVSISGELVHGASELAMLTFTL